jgi:hypothetical protein
MNVCLVSRCANEAPKPVSSNLLLQSIVLSFEEVPGILYSSELVAFIALKSSSISQHCEVFQIHAR